MHAPHQVLCPSLVPDDHVDGVHVQASLSWLSSSGICAITARATASSLCPGFGLLMRGCDIGDLTRTRGQLREVHISEDVWGGSQQGIEADHREQRSLWVLVHGMMTWQQRADNTVPPSFLPYAQPSVGDGACVPAHAHVPRDYPNGLLIWVSLSHIIAVEVGWGCKGGCYRADRWT